MFKHYYDKLIRHLARDHITRAAAAATNLEFDRHVRNREIDEEYVIKSSIHKKVIFCPNEWSDPVFGTVAGISVEYRQRWALVKNALTGEDVLLFANSFFIADDKMVKALLKLNPLERWNISVCRQHHMAAKWNKTNESDTYTPSEELYEKLKAIGFVTESYTD